MDTITLRTYQIISEGSGSFKLKLRALQKLSDPTRRIDEIKKAIDAQINSTLFSNAKTLIDLLPNEISIRSEFYEKILAYFISISDYSNAIKEANFLGKGLSEAQLAEMLKRLNELGCINDYYAEQKDKIINHLLS